MDSSKEAIIKELTNLEKNYDEIDEIPEILEKYLNDVARTGDVGLKWDQFKPLVKKKIEFVVSEFNDTHPCINLNQPNVTPFDFEEVKRNILTGIDSFDGPPFTVQRICELLTNPYKHYKRADKFMKGLEKNVMVVSEETFDQRTENGNSSFTNYLNSTFTLQPPSTSDSINNNQSSLLFNGFKYSPTENSYNQILNNNCPNAIQTPPIQQLDSFTTVFVSQSQTTQLEEIVNIPIFDSTTNPTSTTTVNQSNSCLISLSPNVAVTSVDSTLECNGQFDKIIEQQSQITIDTIETVNTEQPSRNEIVDVPTEANKVIVVQEDDKIAVVESKSNTSVEIVNEQEDEFNVSVESVEQEETIDSTPTKENKDLKRVYESPEADSIKRFKSDNIEDNEKLTELDDSKESTPQTAEPKEESVTNELSNANANQVDANEQKVESCLNQQEQSNADKSNESEITGSSEDVVKNLEPIESTE